MTDADTFAGAWALDRGWLILPQLAAAGFGGGVTTRALGSMKNPENRAAAAHVLGAPAPAYLRQAHGVQIYSANIDLAAKEPREGDGWTVSQTGISAGVYIADCMPLFLWAADGSCGAVVHSGWRGTLAGIAAKAVAALASEHRASPKILHAAAGPHIRSCCYRVGAEFEAKNLKNALIRRGDELYLDLAEYTRAELAAAGVLNENIHLDSPCTSTDAEHFFSFRRDKNDSRMLALLWRNP